MAKTVSDTEIRTRVRSVVAHHRLDMQRLTLRIARGTVRVGGELLWLGRSGERLPLAILEALERDLARLRGVRQYFFDLKNWRRAGPGEWSPVERDGSRRAPSPAERAEETEAANRSGEPEPSLRAVLSA